MKSITIEVSDELAEHLETARDIFTPGGNVGKIIDDLASWYFKDIATKDYQLFQEIECLEFDSREEALALSKRIEDHLEKIGADVPVAWFTFTNSNGKTELRELQNAFDEAIYDACSERGVSYDSARSVVGPWMVSNPGTSALEALDAILAKERAEKVPVAA